MRVLVCGGRNYQDETRVAEVLQDLAERHGWLTIIHGGATGADDIARRWAMNLYHGTVAFHADWARHGKAAGPIRNQLMLDGGQPDMVVAFPGGVGTADMVRRARAAGVEVIEIR